MIAPTANEASEAPAATTGEGSSPGSTPSSSSACTASALSGFAEISAAACRAVAALTPRARSMVASSACSKTGLFSSSSRSLLTSAWTSSFCEETDTYSPAAIEHAPAARPARPVSTMVCALAAAAAHPGDQRRVGDQPVHGAEHGRPQPAAGHVPVVVPVIVSVRVGPGSLLGSHPDCIPFAGPAHCQEPRSALAQEALALRGVVQEQVPDRGRVDTGHALRRRRQVIVEVPEDDRRLVQQQRLDLPGDGLLRGQVRGGDVLRRPACRTGRWRSGRRSTRRCPSWRCIVSSAEVRNTFGTLRCP